MTPATAPQLLDTLLERTRAAIKAAKLERLLPTLDHIERTQRTQLLQMIEATFAAFLLPAVPPPGSLKGRASIDPKRFKGLLSVLNNLLANAIARRSPFVYPVVGETVFGDSRDMLRLGAPQLDRSMEFNGLLGPGDRLTLDSLHALERRGVDVLKGAFAERIDPHFDKALPSSSHELLLLPEGTGDFLRSAIYQEDRDQRRIQVAYWQALAPDLARRLFPHLPPGYEGWVWGTDGHRVHAVAVPRAPQRSLRKGKLRFVPISPLALADSDTLQIHTWGYRSGDAGEEAVTVTPNTLSRRAAEDYSPYDLNGVINDIPACKGPADESPIATCKGFSVKAFKAALKNLKAEAKHLALKLSDLPFLFRLKDGRARLIAQGPGAPDIKGRVEVVELAERELEGWTVDPSIQTNLNPDYALDAFGALGDFTLVCRPDKNDPHIITSAARPHLSAVIAPIRS